MNRNDRNRIIKKDLERITKFVDKIKKTDEKFFEKEYYKNIMVQNFRDDELMNISNMMRDIEHYKLSVLNGMFRLRKDDDKDKMNAQKEVLLEHMKAERRTPQNKDNNQFWRSKRVSATCAEESLLTF